MRKLCFTIHLLAMPLVLSGCHGYYSSRMQADQPNTAIVPEHPWAPSGLPMFEGETGRVATWADLFEGIAWADVVVLGEEHDDVVAHQFQLAVVEQMLASWPKTAVALEMLERDQQDAVEAYLAGNLDEEELLGIVTSSDRSSEKFADFYLPIVDAAGLKGAPVVAANAPRRYVRMARLSGWEELEQRPPEERQLYDIPTKLDEGSYRKRIEELIQEHEQAPTRENVDAILRAQQVWDRTMATSVLRALEGMDKVVLLVGRFHGDFAGGTVQQIHSKNAFVKVLYVSTIDLDEQSLRKEDRDRADLVVYTGGVSTDADDIDPIDDMPIEQTDEPSS